MESFLKLSWPEFLALPDGDFTHLLVGQSFDDTPEEYNTDNYAGDDRVLPGGGPQQLGQDTTDEPEPTTEEQEPAMEESTT